MFLVQPYLQFATTDSITIMCETSRPAKMRVDYAEVRPLEEHAETDSPKLISELTLKGLQPATRYFYRVACTDEKGQEVRGQQYSFSNRAAREHAVGVCRHWRYAAQSGSDA